MPELGTVDAAAAARELDAAVRAAGDPVRAVQSHRYLKSELRFYGAPVGAARTAVRRWVRAHAPGRAGVLAVATLLWDEPAADPVFERRLLAALLLADRVELLSVADLGLVERFVREARTWALVDVLAGDVAGGIAGRHGDVVTPVLDAWVADEDFWLRRTALLAHLRDLRAGAGDWARFTRYADAMLGEREFFVRKAIGWVLRDTGRRRPELVHRWLLPRAARASGLTVREAVKHLPEPMAAGVLAARGPARRGRSSRSAT